MKPTGFKADSNLFEGQKLYVQRARNVLPILVRQAKAGNPIYYSELAKEIGISNPRNLNYILGAIGNALINLEKTGKFKNIPPINCLVINKSTNLPGEGIVWFIKKSDFTKLNKKEKIKTVKQLLIEIYSYPYWELILKELKLKPIEQNFKKLIEKNKKRSNYSTGESQEHINFKNYLIEHPEIFGLNSSFSGETEYMFPSLDTVDILFKNKYKIIGVEAKSYISDEADIFRGLYQCIKYKALIEAEQKVNNLNSESRVLLALEGEFPNKLLPLKNLLGIEILDNIKQ